MATETPVRTIGYAATQGAARAGLRKGDVLDAVIRCNAQNHLVATLLLAAQKRRRIKQDYTYTINIQEARPRYVTVTGVNSATEITVSVGDSLWIQGGMELRLDHDTTVLVSSVAYATGVVTLAGDGTNLTVGDKLAFGNPASEEYSSAPTPITRKPNQTTNYIETSRICFGTSRHQKNIAYYGGTRWAQSRQDAITMAKEDVAKGLWNNVARATTGTGSRTLYKTGGAMYLANAAGNVGSFDGGKVSYRELARMVVESARVMPSKTLWLACSEKGANLINQILFGKVAVNTFRDEKLGVNCKEIEVANRTIVLMPDDYFGANAALESTMVLMDPSGLNLATVKDQETGEVQWMMENENILNDGTDGQLSCITTDFGADFVPNYLWLWTDANDYQL